MHSIRHVTRLGVLLATLGIIALTFAGSASASPAMFPDPGARTGPVPVAPPVTAA